MKKSSKIWKIVKYGHSYYSGQYVMSNFGPYAISIQNIYDTELDCLLDIVTEPDNHGLKVYKHQGREVGEIDLTSKKEFMLITPSTERWSFESKYHTKEEVDAMDPSTFKITYPDDPMIESYEKTVYHWVDAFLQ